MKHALEVRYAFSSGNYVLFFKLYKMAPNLNSCLMGKDDLSLSRIAKHIHIYCPIGLTVSVAHTLRCFPLYCWITDLYVERMRFVAMKCMSKSYRPTVPVRYAARVLGFVGIDEVCEANGADGLEECEEWLKAHGAVLSVDNNGELQIDTKVNLEPGSPGSCIALYFVTLLCPDIL